MVHYNRGPAPGDGEQAIRLQVVCRSSSRGFKNKQASDPRPPPSSCPIAVLLRQRLVEDAGTNHQILYCHQEDCRFLLIIQ